MSYEVVFSQSFRQSVKRLRKRFRHVKDDINLAIKVLLQNPGLGVLIPGGSAIRKLRVNNSDLTKGKSGGYRLLYHVQDEPVPTLRLLLMYAKSDKESVTRQELQQLLNELGSKNANFS